MFAELKKIEAEWKARMHKALYFDGKDDYVEVQDSESLNITNKITFTAWIYAYNFKDGGPGPHYYPRIIDKGRRWLLASHDDGITAIQSAANGCDDTTVLYTNRWYHLAVTINNQHIIYYVNGEKSTEHRNCATLPYTPNTYNLAIGSKFDGSERYFHGLIDEVRIYNRALSPSEIKYLYHNPFDLIDPEHLVLWLNLAGIDVANGKWWDLSGKGNHGTIHGATEVKLVEDEVIVK